ncbi:hypothetical protein K504DRAFT_459866 [Pleomassaria siparia CBS 279.74]|uniref:CCHC-type domain-containing protein n=1 Tax=Pleomassaria siparia CBS 279.74 TaxID=1314801 RepID=A0A6G1JZY5_9PLEO|nr:hypothetical protein K504DRAFT_459866 [Pleomassaria siparia CBS 279.74]
MASNTPKSMSNRLMTMKFMQRGAAKVASEPSTPNGPPSKRVRLSNGGYSGRAPNAPSDHEVIQAALAAEEKVRQDAVDKASAKAGETKWVLSFQDPQDGSKTGALEVVEAGFAFLDADDDSDEEEEVRPTRMKFGGGVPREKPVAFDEGGDEDEDEDEDESDEESNSSSEDYDSDDPTAELIRETKRAAAAKEREMKKARRRSTAEETSARTSTRTQVYEDADLGGLTSLSGQRRGGLSGSGLSNMECHRCKKKGHKSIDCPNNSRGGGPRGSLGRGRGRR